MCHLAKNFRPYLGHQEVQSSTFVICLCALFLQVEEARTESELVGRSRGALGGLFLATRSQETLQECSGDGFGMIRSLGLEMA